MGHVGGRDLTRAMSRGAMACAFLLPTIANADPPTTTSRALPPGAASIVRRSLERAAPTVNLQSARIESDHADLSVCHASGACFAVRLDDPRAGCPDPPAGPFCLRYPTTQPPADARDALARAFAVEDPRTAWIDLAPPVGSDPPLVASRHRAAVDGRHPTMQSIAALLAMTVLPFAIGIALGLVARRFRRRRSRSRALAIALFVVPTVVGFLLAWRTARIGLWDLSFAGLLAGFGTWIAAHESALPLRSKKLVLLASSTLFALVVAEIAARAMLPPTPPIDPADAHRLLIDARDADRRRLRFDSGREDGSSELRRALYENGASDYFAERIGRASDGRRRVLHIGDSMVFGLGVERAAAFPSVLESLEPDVAHINAGIPSLAPDGYLILLRRWIARAPVDRVIVHLFTGNDVSGLDASYPFCADGPLLDYGNAVPRWRCPAPDERFARGRLRWMLAHSPPPLWLREMGSFSMLARRTSLGLVALRSRALPDVENRGDAWRHLEQILTAMRDELSARHIALVVDVLPERSALEAFDPTITEGYATRLRMVSLVRSLGVRVLDPWDEFAQAVHREGSARWFARAMQNDLHFSVEGHALLARWLHAELNHP